MHNLTFIDEDQKVDMGTEWFDIAHKDHFWMKRRWEVISKLLPVDIKKSSKDYHIADIGCGIGTQTSILEKYFGSEIHGFDLDGLALAKAAKTNPNNEFYCMDLLNPKEEFLNKYDYVFVLDVIEHLTDPANFILSIHKLLKKNAIAVFNVPAFNWLYSAYDIAAGHHTRYNSKTLLKAIKITECQLINWSYWGMPFIPLLTARKFLLKKPNKNTIKVGFSSHNQLLNNILGFIGNFEIIPNQFCGTSLTMIFRKI